MSAAVVLLTRGLAAPIEKRSILLKECEKYVNEYNDVYEVIFSNDRSCRAFIDIDGKMSHDTSKDDFERMHEMIMLALSSLDCGTPFSICTSSKYATKDWKSGESIHKLSYSLLFMERHGKKAAVAKWTQDVIAPLLKETLSLIIPFYIKGVDEEAPTTNYLDYDNSVYRENGKMRCLHSTKPKEDRPKILCSDHSILDTMITYIPEDCEWLLEPSSPPAPVVIVREVEHNPAMNDALYKIIMGLQGKRADDYKDWLTVGMALHHEGANVETWVEFSKQSAKYRWGECERLWRGFRQGSLTQRTLWKMLKEDNPQEFKVLCLHRTDLDKTFGDGPTHFRYAQHFVNCRPDDYMYDGDSGWWSLQSNKTWKNSGAKMPPTFKTVLSRTLYSELEEWGTHIRTALFECTEGDRNKEFYENQMKKSLKGRQSCLTSGFIKSVADFCEELYAEQTATRLEIMGKTCIAEIMDINPMIFAFQNDVYDFNMNQDGTVIERRPIEANDYITITCGYPYPTRNPVVRRHIEEVIQGIWSRQGEFGDNGETYEYVMKILSSTLCGVRWMEAFYILTGSGRNGKGLLFELLQVVLGDYYYPLPVPNLTTKIDNPRAANPDIANLAGKRLACSSEPEANEKLNEGTIKFMTGGDLLTGRHLYGVPIRFKPQFGLFLQCNNIPHLNGITRGGVMRNRVIPFPFEFKSNPQTTREKASDPRIKNVLCKSAEWRDEMFFMLLDRFEGIREKGVDEIEMSELIKERTDEYVEENNMIGVWWTDNYEPCIGQYVLSKEAFTEFKIQTLSALSDKQFKAGLQFNLIEIKKIGKRGPLKDKMGIVDWKRREKKVDDLPGEKE